MLNNLSSFFRIYVNKVSLLYNKGFSFNFPTLIDCNLNY